MTVCVIFNEETVTCTRCRKSSKIYGTQSLNDVNNQIEWMCPKCEQHTVTSIDNLSGSKVEIFHDLIFIIPENKTLSECVESKLGENND